MIQALPYNEPVAGLSKVPPNTLKHNDTFGVFGRNGDVLSGASEAQGLFHNDTRYLSQFVLRVEGEVLVPTTCLQSDDNTALTFEYIPRTTANLRVTRIRFLLNDTWMERIELHNGGGIARDIGVEFSFAADFADIFEARGARRARRGRYEKPDIAGDTVTLAYVGLDNRRRATSLRFSPVPARLSGETASFDIPVEAGATGCIHAEIVCDGMPSGQPAHNFSDSLADLRRERKALAARAAAVATGNDDFNRLLHRTRADLSMLLTETEFGSYPYAGIPWYSTPFGRDALITALMTLWMDPEIAKGVLGYLAANQAQDVNRKADSEPGKILHEVRRGEMAELGEVPFRRYYGSIDSTPLFLMLGGAYLERTGDVETLRRLQPQIRLAAEWLETFGDRDHDGISEYYRESDNGLINQGWKDSTDSVFHADGQLAAGSIALVEVQGYIYEAKLSLAEIARALGATTEAIGFEEQALQLKERVEGLFWSSDLMNYVLALDGEKKPCRVQASNAGHLLFCRLPSAERAAIVAETLMRPEFYSGWGIRTLAEGQPRYDAESYYDGSVWPHDNALIGMGFGHYGFRDKAAKVLEGLFDASCQTSSRRLPELFAGFRREDGRGPVSSEEIACSPQAWVTASPLGLLQACLGMCFEVAQREVVFTDPYLPHYFGGKVILHNLRLADSSIDVALEGEGYDVRLEILASTGAINAVIRKRSS
jgi:glycogen debranching enzyme